MSKELEALQKLRDLVENLTRIDYMPTDLRNEVKELLIESYENSNGYFSQIAEALNELEDAKHNYEAMVEKFNNVVAYATKIQKELNELNKRNEPMKVLAEKHYVGFGYFKCPKCGVTISPLKIGEARYNYCPDCGKALDWSDEK